MRPRFLSQKMAQKLPEKKMPSMAAYATSRSAKESVLQRRRTAPVSAQQCVAKCPFHPSLDRLPD